ncbi:hypothetical protein [Chitinophaga sp. Cy-1792]|uniref:hypothetical protein n=1 Tax=Chitinophaga sp. Cy-1792 TaxID=2608339 RepID=UPI00142255BB|nr:hypothetical protein [Chitinophaga sp. Cy-1792]NIG57512.1 hypothetical protein [Chitinophaga sp. Cy-1792]
MLKLPLLVIHYEEHHRLNNDLTVGDFLSMHYCGQDDHDDDEDRDMQLPFKRVNIQVLQQTYIPQERVTTLRQQQESNIAEKTYPILKDHYLPEPAVSSLFRPPKVTA